MRIHEEYLALGELWADSDNYCRGAGSTTTSQRIFVNTPKEKIEELLAGGRARKDASVAARRQFGNLTSVEEDRRAVWGWTVIESFLADTPLRATNHAAQYRDSIAASGIGANTAIFSLINTLTLWTLPVRDPVNL